MLRLRVRGKGARSEHFNFSCNLQCNPRHIYISCHSMNNTLGFPACLLFSNELSEFQSQGGRIFLMLIFFSAFPSALEEGADAEDAIPTNSVPCLRPSRKHETHELMVLWLKYERSCCHKMWQNHKTESHTWHNLNIIVKMPFCRRANRSSFSSWELRSASRSARGWPSTRGSTWRTASEPYPKWPRPGVSPFRQT